MSGTTAPWIYSHDQRDMEIQRLQKRISELEDELQRRPLRVDIEFQPKEGRPVDEPWGESMFRKYVENCAIRVTLTEENGRQFILAPSVIEVTE